MVRVGVEEGVKCSADLMAYVFWGEQHEEVEGVVCENGCQKAAKVHFCTPGFRGIRTADVEPTWKRK